MQWFHPRRLPVLFLCIVPALWAERIPGRYIVELSTESVAEHLGRQTKHAGFAGTAAAAHRARLAGEQQQVRGLVEQRQGVVLDSVQNIANALFVQIPDDQAAQLASLPGVRRVLPARAVHMLLDRAVQVNKIADVWNEAGTDRAGTGVKIAIIDSGIDNNHAAFQNSSLTVPDSYPRVNATSDQTYTNNKIIVARSYVSLLPSRDPDRSARDRVGHGTALAMIAAGQRATGPLASIAGIAPQAYLGSYKVFGTPGYNDSSSEDAILKAIDDAVADGMDVINLSLGSDFAPRLADDLEVQAVERASAAGVIVVAAAGNNGPDYSTLSSPATAPSAIAVGASSNSRTFGGSATVDGLPTVLALNGNGVTPGNPLSGRLVDVANLDGTGQACSALTPGSLSGSVALILRGNCNFSVKLTNAQNAGAIAALVYAAADAPDPISMDVGTATLPAQMISNSDGIAAKQALAGQSSLLAAMDFTQHSVELNSNRLASFTASGPNVDYSVKPDLVAVGADMYTATQTYDQNGEMYDATGFILVDGTSFSTPMVAGTAALIKSLRPGLTVAQYRSLLINSASTIDSTARVQQSGAGALNAYAALHSTVVSYPTSLGFGVGSGDVQTSQTLTLTNVGASADTFQIQVTPREDGAVSPTAASSSVDLAPGASVNVPVTWQASGLTAGAYEGFIRIVSTNSGAETRIPYWYAVASQTPAHITILDSLDSARRNSIQTDAVLFRFTDSAGVVLPDVQPRVTVVSGGGSVRQVVSYDSDIPGLFSVSVRLGSAAGDNVFRIQAGDAVSTVTITGQ